MTNTNDLEFWSEAQEYPIRVDKDGLIIDFIDPDIKRQNTPEERVRQRSAQSLHFEFGYPKELIGIEKTVNIGREKKRADIVIYETPEDKAVSNQGKILLLAEVKSPEIKEPDGQLFSYLSATPARGGFWTNGTSLTFYRKSPDGQEILSWLGIPKYGLAWDSVGRFTKKDLIVPIDLKLAFKRCHNAIYRSGIDSEDIALDMVRIILAKVEDESSGKPECDFHITPEEFRDPQFKSVACLRVRALFERVRDKFPDVFQKHEEITASDDQLAIVITHLQPYALLSATYDVIGTAYEVYVASHLKGERGQYFTNRLVVNMMVRMLDPNDNDVILDPACGSGGFLISALNYVANKIDDSDRISQAKDLVKRNISQHLFGVDTTPKLVKVAKTNMLLTRDGHTGIIRGDSLGTFTEFPAHFNERGGGKGKPTMILTNPPFGAGHDLRIKEADRLKNFKLGHVWTQEGSNVRYTEQLNSRQGVAPELLFLERCIEWLADGGVLGIVMAKGQLDNREAYAARKMVLEKCQLLGVINLHEDTFEPFTGAKASVVLVRKKSQEVKKDYPIFMAISNKVGQTSRGEPIFKKDAEGNPVIHNNAFILDEDLGEIADAYADFKQGTLEQSPYHFSINRSMINDSLSFNPVQYLPEHNAALQKVIEICDGEDFTLQTLGTVAKVFNGPRFKRPYAELGNTSGPTVRKYFTGTALTQLNSDNVKYLDSSKADKQVKKHLDQLTIYKGYILISDSGTLGRITYALNQHDGHVATNNLIRIVIDDINLRGYVLQYLKSSIGQSLILKNAYGTNQEHLEPDVISEVPIPIPKDRTVIDTIGAKVISSIEELERSLEFAAEAESRLEQLLA